MTSETPETSHAADVPDAEAGEGGGLIEVLRAAARSPWPSPVAVACEAARRVRFPRCGVAVRGLRVVGVLSLSGLALSSDRTNQTHLRQAFSHVASSLGREPEGDPGNGDGVPVDTLGFRPPVPPTQSASGARAWVPGRQRPPVVRRLLGPVGLPVRGPISSPFGPRVHPVSGRRSVHRGVDVAVPVGTPVRATGAGHVVAAGFRSGYGLTVEVGHGGAAVSTLYAHLDAVPAGVQVGAVVRRGTVVGWSGGVGPQAGLSTGPHVHYEVRVRGVAVDVARPVRARALVQGRALAQHGVGGG